MYYAIPIILFWLVAGICYSVSFLQSHGRSSIDFVKLFCAGVKTPTIKKADNLNELVYDPRRGTFCAVEKNVSVGSIWSRVWRFVKSLCWLIVALILNVLCSAPFLLVAALLCYINLFALAFFV